MASFRSRPDRITDLWRKYDGNDKFFLLRSLLCSGRFSACVAESVFDRQQSREAPISEPSERQAADLKLSRPEFLATGVTEAAKNVDGVFVDHLSQLRLIVLERVAAA
jgi:hypothetical protein